MTSIIFKNVCKSFGEKNVLSDFSYEFANGSHTCIMGASGIGKTTLLNLVLGLEKADSGEISGVPDNISAVFQEDRLSESFSAVANVVAVTGKSVSESEIMECLFALGLSGDERIPVSELSGGMKRRVAIARALLKKSELVVLDEPFKGLDEEMKLKTISVILDYTKGKTLIVATHDSNDTKLLGAEILNI